MIANLQKRLSVSVLLVVLFYHTGNSQNLVNNHGFETNSANPSDYNELPLAKGWSNCNGTFGATNSYGTPDYYTSGACCGLQLPYTGSATVYADSGNCIMGEVLYDGELSNYREYARTFLTSPLVIGRTYVVYFFCSTGSSDQVGEYTSNRLGLLFSVDSTTQKTYEVLSWWKPQIEIDTQVHPTGWQKYSFLFKADSAYKYITIGNFFPDDSTKLYYTFSSGSAPYAYYFFDNFSVVGDNVSHDTTICKGSSVTLLAHFFSSYSWSTTSNSTPFSTDSIVTVTPTSSTNYIISSGTFNDTIKVKVKSVFPLSVSSNQTLCGGGSATLSASGDSSYLWSPSSGLSCTNCSSTIATPIGSTTYKVIGFDSGCATMDSVVVSVLPIILLTNDTTICYGTSAKLNAFSNVSVTWSPSTGLNSTTGYNVIADPTTTTTYTVTADSGGCFSAALCIVSIVKASVDVLPVSPSICEGSNIVLSAVSGLNSYQWSPSTGLNVTIGSSVIAGPTTTTTYTIFGVDTTGCNGDTTLVVTVNPKPFIVADSNIACSGIPATLKVSGTEYYSWSPDYALTNTSGDSVIATPTITTTYTVVGTNSYGCTDTTYSVLTIFEPPNKPIITQHGDTLISSGKTDNQWFINDTLIPGATSRYLVITRQASYTVVIVDPANGCSNVSEPLVTSGINRQLNSLRDQVVIYPNPTVDKIYITINTPMENLQNWKLQFSDMLGRVVQVVFTLKNTNEINLIELPDGFYFMSLINGVDKIVFPIIKQN